MNKVSHLVRGAWIEINRRRFLPLPLLSHLVRGAWIEIGCGLSAGGFGGWSHLVRGAWIEIRHLPFASSSF